MFNISLKLLILLQLYILYNCPNVQANCEIELSSDPKKTPRVQQLIGSTYLEANITQHGYKVRIAIDDFVIVFCDTYFRYIHTNYHKRSCFTNRQKSLRLACSSRTGLECMRNSETTAFLECVQLNWTIAYKKDEQFSWCNNNSSSTTLLMTSKVNDVNLILARLCYDFEKISIRAVRYNVQYAKKTNQEMLESLEDVELTPYRSVMDDLRLLKATNSSIITNEMLQLNLLGLGNEQFLLTLANYEVTPIVQGHSYANVFQEYSDILDTIWWRNLRLGNWKSFIDTLENYAQNNSFQISTGTSGVVKVPINAANNQSKIFELKNEANNLTIPAYIWSFVKSMDGQNENFVIFAYNSPFAEILTSDNIIFCPDICSEIPWLQKIYRAFRYTFAGVMFCCKPDSIKDTKNIGGVSVEMFNN